MTDLQFAIVWLAAMTVFYTPIFWALAYLVLPAYCAMLGRPYR